MSFNVAEGSQLTINTFGGLITEVPASNVPESGSPDNQDCQFWPGAVGSRDGLKKVFATPFSSGSPAQIGTVTYAKSYVDPQGIIRNLYLDSDGQLWIENVTASAGTYTLLAASTAGSYAKSTTAFGREYIAISDKLHGSDVPLQYDGTNLDRVTQDGPGSPPSVGSFALPAVAMVSGSGVVLTIVSLTSTDLGGGFYSSLTITVVSGASALMRGDAIVIAGTTNSVFNGQTYPVLYVVGDDTIVCDAWFPVFETGTGGTATISAFTMQRAGNTVTVKTATAHRLQVGYRAQIAGMPANATIGSGVKTITINNTDNPGIATIETNIIHGLVPGLFVGISAVSAVTVGTSIITTSRQGQVVTISTTTAHGLRPGALVTISGVADGTFNGSFVVQQVPTPGTFSYIQGDVDATSSGGLVKLDWPIPDVGEPIAYEVLAAPTTTTFQVAINYADAIWTTGVVSQAWDGIFFVSAVPSATTFQYQQYGPVAMTTVVGTVTPYGQVAPGEHQCQVLFLTRQGYTTRPSPPIKFIANGGQYVSVTNIPIGPSNVIARILAFTGARGSSFYYIPVPAQFQGQVVSTATQINDNTTTSAVLDFSDNTLFAALGINTIGNNLPAQIILDGALGFGHFGSRLITYGQRNIIQNLLNMSFDGGHLPSDSTMPTGWIAAGSPVAPGGQLTTSGHYGDAWQITGAGSIYQGFYEDAYGAPIATPKAKYSIRAWIKGTGTIALTISSAATGFTSSVTLTGTSTTGAWVEGSFSTQMPTKIPTDMILSLSGTTAAIVDEISIIYTDTPFLDNILFGSYVNNPEGFDGLSGKFGPANDTRKVMTFGLIRGTLFLLTRDPSGRLHAVIDNGVTEPAGWTINEVATNCGVVSAFCLTVSQADDASGGGGEEWIAWASAGGGKYSARIFGGDQPWKISQEIQPDWDNINPAAALTMWACNDPGARVLYFGLPVGIATAPNLIYPVDYKNLDTAYQIGQSAPVYRAPAGKMGAGEFCRKWTRWNLTMNGAVLMYRQDTGQLYINFLAGNGIDPASPGSPAQSGFGNVYILCPDAMTDDDFGQIFPYYTTYFFPSHQLEAVLGLGSQRKMLEFFQYLALGVGQLRISFLSNALDNVWPLNCIRDLSLDPQFDIEHPGASATGQRIAFKFEGLPVGTI